MRALQAGGAEAFILDLRNNPGGLVRAGLDIARLWLDGNSAIFNVQARFRCGWRLPGHSSTCSCCSNVPVLHHSRNCASFSCRVRELLGQAGLRACLRSR